MDYQQNSEVATEIIFGIIGPIGCNRELVIDSIINIAKHFNYRVVVVKVSKLIEEATSLEINKDNQYTRVMRLMDVGNRLRMLLNDNSVLSKMAAAQISKERKKNNQRTIYVINSLKHPEEVEILRDIYKKGFYLFAIHSEEEQRNQFLERFCHINEKEKRKELIDRDKDEKIGYGQSTSSAFHLADFFLAEDGDNKKIWNSMERYFDLIFGSPYRTPTFQEYSMFMAHAAALKSADLSRQVGAVLTQDRDIISSGANECPKAFGGTYWPEFNDDTNEISDEPDGRDYMRGMDYNGKEKSEIINKLKMGLPNEVIKKLEENISNSGIKDITEFGRVVHAEMDAILACARRGISTKNSIMFCTTHPCHNCAKHIVASGIDKVFYIEPYPKSKALDMHNDSITINNDQPRNKVKFKAFIGVGPRQYLNLFSMHLSDGKKIKRKTEAGHEKVNWSKMLATPRIKNFAHTHLDIENTIVHELSDKLLNLRG